MIVGMVILVFRDLIEKSDHGSGWLVYHTSESKINYSSISMNNQRKEPPIPRKNAMKEIDSAFDPMDDKWILERGESYSVQSLDPVT